MPGHVFMISPGQIIKGAPCTFTFVETQAKSLEDLGWTVTLSVVDDRTSILGITENVRRLRAEVRSSAAELVHAQYGSVTAAVADVVRGSLPLVISFCGEDLLGTPEPGILWRLRSRTSRRIGLIAAWRAQTIIVKSRNLFTALPSSLQGRAEILPNGVDEKLFVPRSRAEARSKLGWSFSEPIVLFYEGMRGHKRRKNNALADLSMANLRETCPSARLVKLSCLLQEEVALNMNAADCLLVTSIHEGSPNIVKEAMSCNLPVVSVPCGDVEERLARVKPGSVVSYDADQLASSIRQVLEVGARSNGREELTRQRLTTRTVAGQLTGIYERVRAKSNFTCVR